MTLIDEAPEQTGAAPRRPQIVWVFAPRASPPSPTRSPVRPSTRQLQQGFPLFAFVFLVALGIDYNVFLMTRVREETLEHGTRRGVVRGLAVTGGVITSAGLVLAATFVVLGVLPIVFLAELGFTVAVGVLLDTIVVRSILVPALSHEIGKKIWWPSKLAAADAMD
jgi:uncharacterized membrane protein YdfJ with MMPL/SSD domain